MVFQAQLEAVDVHNKEENLGSLNVLQEAVSHTKVDVSALYEPRQISHADLEIKKSGKLV